MHLAQLARLAQLAQQVTLYLRENRHKSLQLDTALPVCNGCGDGVWPDQVKSVSAADAAVISCLPPLPTRGCLDLPTTKVQISLHAMSRFPYKTMSRSPYKKLSRTPYKKVQLS